MVATSVAARGIDVKDVGAVINYDMPKDHTEYIHRWVRIPICKNFDFMTFLELDELPESDMMVNRLHY